MSDVFTKNDIEFQEIRLKQRKDAPKGYYYCYCKGKNYSVIDFGITMKEVSINFNIDLGYSWEAMLLKKNGRLDTDVMFRAKTKKELFKQLLDN